VLRLAGYKDAVVELPAADAESMQVDLERAKPAARSAARSRAAHSGEDGTRERLPPAPDPAPVPVEVESEVLDPWG
jgi:hypothetical protein